MTLPASITTHELAADFTTLEIRHPKCSASIALNGGHVMHWTPTGHAPVLYMSPVSLLQPGKAIRGGVPICWPWFGPHPSSPDLAAHGFARNMPWQLMAAAEDADGVTLELGLNSSPATKQLWPHDFELRLIVRLGSAMDLSLRMKNKDDQPFTITGALHTYLCVADISQTVVYGLEGSRYVESRLSPEQILQEGPVTFDREVDRNYASASTVKVEDRAGNRRLILEKSGSQATVVWNPWIEKSKRLSDLPDEAYHHFLCVEAANSGLESITLAPGECHELTQRVSIV
jgi:glucose-6-phosphate 1-epimerase